MVRCPDQMKDGSPIPLEDQEQYGGDYACDVMKRVVSLTAEGQNKLLSVLVANGHLSADADINTLWGHSRAWGPLVMRALQAQACYFRDTHYVVVDAEVKIIQESTGRISDKTRWMDGMHQAVEAKEGLPIRGDNVTFASITYMMFFGMFTKLAGMTGTAMQAKYELFVNYRLPVYVIPPHRAMKRTDIEPRLYPDRSSKFQAVGRLVVGCFNKNRPVLIGTESVEDSVLLHDALQRWYPGLKCQLLNAKPEFVSLEAEIVAQAGLPAAVTISTAMAGRGVDIKLGGDPTGLTKGALQRKLFPWLLQDGEVAVSRLPYFRIPIETTEPGQTVLPPMVSGLLDRALALARCNVEKGSYSRRQVDEFIDLVIGNAQLILQKADREAVATGSQVQLVEHLAHLMVETERTVNGDSVLKVAVNAAMGLTLFFREYCTVLGDEVRQAGGLLVIGASWMPNERVAAQLCGRAGRQGDPGESVILSCPEDVNLVPLPGFYRSMLMQDAEGLPIGLLSKLNLKLYHNQEIEEATRSQMKRDDEVFQEFRISWYKLRRLFLTGAESDVTGVLFQYVQATVEETVAKYVKNKHINLAQPPQNWKLDLLFDEVTSIVNGPVGLPAVEESLNAQGVSVNLFNPIQIRLKFMTSHHRQAVMLALANDTAMPDYEHDYPITIRMKTSMRRHINSNGNVSFLENCGTHTEGKYQRQAIRLQQHLVGAMMVAYFMHRTACIDLGSSEAFFSKTQRTYLLSLMDSLYVTFLQRAGDLKSALLLQTPDQRNTEDGFAGLLREEFVSLLQMLRRTAIPHLFRIVPSVQRMTTVDPPVLLGGDPELGENSRQP